MSLKIIRKIKSKTITYLVLPHGFKTDDMQAALDQRQPGDRVVEYTMIIKDITVTNDGRVVAKPRGEYMQSRDIQ